MNSKLLAMAAVIACTAAAAPEPKPSSAFDRGSSLQAAQDPRLAAITAKCKTPPPAARARPPAAADVVPPPALPATRPIPGVLAFGRTWKVVWAWEGNNADGPIAADDGSILFANNDASNVMQLDPDTGLATVIYDRTNTGGALSRSKNGALFLAVRGVGGGIEQLEPTRRMFVDTFAGEPLECVGGTVNDLVADAHGGVYLAISGSGVFYANPQGVLARYGDVKQVNGIILSPDEKTLYVTNGAIVVSFDVQPDGALTNQSEFGRLRGGRAGDGSAVDSEGRLYVSTGSSVDVFSPDGGFLGSIAAPKGTHGVVLGGKDGRTLFGIVFYGGWGTSGARNQIVAIPLLASRYTGRAK
jgi:sugar lactone lactonase YvrE